MSYRIPIGTEIFPVTGERAEFFCLPLSENPTAYDRYLVRARDVEPA